MMILPSGVHNKTVAQGEEIFFIDTLAKVFNFTYNLVDNKQKWGRKLTNGSWDGIVGMVQREVIQLILFISLYN